MLKQRPELAMFLVMNANHHDQGPCNVTAQVTHTEHAGFKVRTFPDMEESAELISYPLVMHDPRRSVRLATDVEIDEALRAAVEKNTAAEDRTLRESKTFGMKAEKALRMLELRQQRVAEPA